MTSTTTTWTQTATLRAKNLNVFFCNYIGRGFGHTCPWAPSFFAVAHLRKRSFFDWLRRRNTISIAWTKIPPQPTQSYIHHQLTRRPLFWSDWPNFESQFGGANWWTFFIWSSRVRWNSYDSIQILPNPTPFPDPFYRNRHYEFLSTIWKSTLHCPYYTTHS